MSNQDREEVRHENERTVTSDSSFQEGSQANGTDADRERKKKGKEKSPQSNYR